VTEADRLVGDGGRGQKEDRRQCVNSTAQRMTLVYATQISYLFRSS
jgi:hypothetical protein